MEEVSAASGIPTDQAMIDEGAGLFSANCYSCHRIHSDWTGPALANVWERWENQETLYEWIKNNGAVLASGDAYANELYEAWNGSVMTNFAWLEDTQVTALLAYVQAETVKGPEQDAGSGGEDGEVT
ncbi:MAG: cytochrome c, partial [Bacteroidota bacterium]